MAGRDVRGPDLDDWFAEPRSAPSRAHPDREPATTDEEAGDDWLAGDAPAGRPRLGAPQLTSRQAALAGGALALAILLIGLAVAGVFSGGSSHPAAPATTAPTTTAGTTTSPATTQVQPAATTLKPGDTGPEVKALQQALASLGYAAGKADGRYGPGTQKAVASFQKASGLTADGVLGPKTLAALTKALGKTG